MAYDDLYFSCIDVVSAVSMSLLFLYCQSVMFYLSLLLNQLVIVGIFTFFLYCLAVRFVCLSIVLLVSRCFLMKAAKCRRNAVLNKSLLDESELCFMGLFVKTQREGHVM